MSLLIRGVIGSGVLLAAAIGGVVGIPYLIKWDNAINDTTDNNSLGKKYGRYFLSSKNNGSWWIWKHKIFEKDFSGLKDKFSTVKTGFSESDSTALNKVCEKAYELKESTNLLDSDPSDTQNSKFLKRNIWKYCTPYRLRTVQENGDSYGNNTIGEDNSNKTILVSTKDSENKWFWEIRNDEFWNGSGGRAKSNIQGDSETSAFKQDKLNNRKIKDICEEAYKKNSTSDTTDKNKTDSELFCSIKLDLSSASTTSKGKSNK